MSQLTLWEKWNKEYRSRTGVSSFARECQKHINPGSKLLELGCGTGIEAAYFARECHVTATDFAQSAIRANIEYFKNIQNLEFKVVDTSKPLPFADTSFDYVYACLSLHYFSDDVTMQVFKEINRVLRQSGTLLFLCKSINDSMYGKGQELEKDMYEFNGQIRHFFSTEYAKKCLDGLFNIEVLEYSEQVLNSTEPNLYGENLNFVKCIATKI